MIVALQSLTAAYYERRLRPSLVSICTDAYLACCSLIIPQPNREFGHRDCKKFARSGPGNDLGRVQDSNVLHMALQARKQYWIHHV